MPTLTISAEDVGYLIVKAREFDVKEANSDPDSGSNAIDDNMIDVLEDNGSDPVASEIAGFINSLSEEEQTDLVALMRLGRGDGTIEEWDDLRREAADERERNRHTARCACAASDSGNCAAMLWMRFPAASHFEMSTWAAASKGGGSANSTSGRNAMHFSISSRIAITGLRLPLVA